ncbi:porin [Xylophilus sp. Leaf220]|uniref:porin n=1 Tax=Xylophilus sp. Leaf220 TaxID=1735686 RepID=UPI0006F92916|nr:porin [Xylophilus sp. Leaf220]KQM78439.1 porin [Xylophilus sp. Leaf220]
MQRALKTLALALALALATTAAAGTAALAPAAWAQSSVTIYGRVVGGVEYVDKIRDTTTGQTGSLTRAADNQWGTSMLGFKGSEDLGGGLKANFLLESGFGLKTGNTNGAAFFNRRSYVGLSSASWGSFRLGKNLLISNDVWNLDPTGQQFISSSTLVRGRNWQGASNVIEYSTPDLAGFNATAQIGLGEQVGSTKPLSTAGVSVSYIHQDLELRGIYSQRRDQNGLYTNPYTFSKEGIVGGTYRFGPAKVFAAYDHITAGDGPVTGPTKVKHGWVGVRYDVNGALQLIGAAYRVDTDRVDGKATLLMVGADYYLSKRTFLYASLGGVNNAGNGNFAADVSVNGPGAGRSQRAVYAGMGHSF